MNSSPIIRLISRHVCNCNASTVRNVSRQLSTTASKKAQHWTPTASSYGSSEMLKRRYQPKPAEVDRTKIDHAATKKTMRRAAFGLAACGVGLVATIYFYPLEPSTTTKNAAPPSIPGVPDTSLRDEVEQVPTGTSTIPSFPRSIYLSEVAAPANAAVVDTGKQEYQLVGLGIRTVSFLGIQVYVAGLYVALPDIHKLQERLIRVIDPVATTLVPGEKSKLRDMLLDKEKSEEIWNGVLKDGGIRTVIRIVPTRNTDFQHLRDGWVRGITSKTQRFAQNKKDDSFSDESFGSSLNEFKVVIGGVLKKKVPYGETILLTRDGQGVLDTWYEDKKGIKVNLGKVQDERISRLIWLIYLGGPNVSSESLRQNVVDGIMDYVARPVGTIATQVI